ncbi:M48 family metalloprotease [Streptomyces sp. NPDC032161]|uniref:M48 family metallopeptidase n=1 Tax=unclassified Streptomyces TaxID=2593676 RepID=UPI0033DC235E
MTGPRAAADHLRDPFAVPSGTTLRFALLVLTTTVTVMAFSSSRFAPVEKGVERRFAAYEACWERENATASGLPSGKQPIEEVCGADPRLVSLWVPLTAVLVFWLLVLAVYWVLPRWRIRRRRYVPLGDGSAEVIRALEALRARGRTGPVSWYAQPLDPRVSALAFGRWRHKCVVLSGGLLALRTRQPETFESVVLHELGHIRNRDVDISFITIVAARFGLPVLLITLPAGIAWELLWGLGGAGAMAQGVANSLLPLCLLVVMPLSRRAVLRSREFYADARAWQWSASPLALRALFEAPDARRRPVRDLLRVHPTARRRRAMFDDTAPLFRSGFWELFAVGSVIGVLHNHLSQTYVLNLSLGERAAHLVEQALALGTTGVLLGAAVAFLALRHDEGFPGERPRLMWAPVWGLGCGLALGGGVVNPGTTFTLASTGQSGIGFLPWAVLLSLVLYLSARWMSVALRPWRQALRRRRRAAPAWCVLVAVVGAVFGCVLCWLMELMTAQALMSTILGPGTPEPISFVLGAGADAAVRAPYLLCAFVLAALVPLVGQALAPHAYAGARSGLFRTLGSGLRWGLLLTAGLVLLAFAGAGPLGIVPVTGTLILLAVRTGRRPRDSGLAYAHAVSACGLAAVLAFVTSRLVLALLDCGTGRCAAPDPAAASLDITLSLVPVLLVAACVPSVRKGRTVRDAFRTAVPPLPGDGLGTISMAFGIAAIVLVLLWPLALFLGTLAVALGLAGRAMAARGEARNPGQALAGVVCGAAGAVLALLLAFIT